MDGLRAGEITVEPETQMRNGESHSIYFSDEQTNTLSSFVCQFWRILCILVAFLARLGWSRNAEDARHANNNLQSVIASSSSSTANPGQFNLSTLEQQPTGAATGANAGNARRPMGCREIITELVLLLIPIGNLGLEIATVVWEKLEGENNFDFLLACAAMALVSLLFFTVELHCRPEEIQLFPDIVGLIVTVVQLFLVMIGIVLMEMNGTNPIKMSIGASIAAGVQLIWKMIEAKKRVAIQNRSG